MAKPELYPRAACWQWAVPFLLPIPTFSYLGGPAGETPRERASLEEILRRHREEAGGRRGAQKGGEGRAGRGAEARSLGWGLGLKPRVPTTH